MKKLDEDTENKIKKYETQGMTQQAIAVRLGISRRVVQLSLVRTSASVSVAESKAEEEKTDA